MEMRVLLIEDSKRLQQAVSTGLRKSGYAVDCASDGEEALWLAESNPYDVMILDLMLPKVDGLSVLRRLREQENACHVLILTAKGSVEERVDGLRAGADDYLAKPFAFEELLARVEALVRRSHARKSPRIEIGELVIDTSCRTATLRGETLNLTAREFALLEFLAYRSGEVVSRTEIEAHIYDDKVEARSNVVDSAICTLRRKIDESEAWSLIETRRGLGYRLRAPGQ